MDNECPICKKDDAIQKLSAVVSIGQQSGSFSGPTGGGTYSGGKLGTFGAWTSLTGTTVTELARQLSPPKRPRLPFGHGCSSKVISMGCVGFALFILIGTIGMSRFLEQPAAAVAVGLMAFMTLLAGAMGGYWINSNVERTRQRRFEAEMPIWEEAMRRWDRMYYCFRDDLVFDPATRQSVEPYRLDEFLHAPSDSAPAAAG